jgi:hypothetical protein
VTTLLVETLKTELSQEIRLENQERYTIGAIIPYLYLHNSPVGTFTLEILSGVTSVFSQSFTSADIKTAIGTSDNYAHVFYPIVPQNPVQLDAGVYTIKLSAAGYNALGSSFLGWIRQHENLNNILDYEPVSDSENPLAVRLKVFKRGIT